MNTKHRIYLLLIPCLALLLSAGFFLARAEDEREDREESEEYRTALPTQETVQPESQTVSSKKPKTVTQTIVTPPTTVTRTVYADMTRNDSDRDGLFDEDDPHPTIAEIYIVRDDNRNGIDDDYELAH